MSTVTAPPSRAHQRPGRRGGDPGPAACHAGCDAVTRLEVRRLAPRHTPVRQLAPARRIGLTWPRSPAAGEVAIVAVGYFGYALVRLAVQAGPQGARLARPEAHRGPARGWRPAAARRATRQGHCGSTALVRHAASAPHHASASPGSGSRARAQGCPCGAVADAAGCAARVIHCDMTSVADATSRTPRCRHVPAPSPPGLHAVSIPSPHRLHLVSTPSPFRAPYGPGKRPISWCRGAEARSLLWACGCTAGTLACRANPRA